MLFSFDTGDPTFSGPSADGNLVLTADFGGVVRAFGPTYLGAGTTKTLNLP